MVRRSIWYMAEPPTLRIRHPLRLRHGFLSRPRRAHLAIGCSPVASVSLLYGLAVDCVVPATGSNHLPVPDGATYRAGVRLSVTETSPSKSGDECGIHPT